jgi:hypothetical protein
MAQGFREKEWLEQGAMATRTLFGGASGSVQKRVSTGGVAGTKTSVRSRRRVPSMLWLQFGQSGRALKTRRIRSNRFVCSGDSNAAVYWKGPDCRR